MNDKTTNYSNTQLVFLSKMTKLLYKSGCYSPARDSNGELWSELSEDERKSKMAFMVLDFMGEIISNFPNEYSNVARAFFDLLPSFIKNDCSHCFVKKNKMKDIYNPFLFSGISSIISKIIYDDFDNLLAYNKI